MQREVQPNVLRQTGDDRVPRGQADLRGFVEIQGGVLVAEHRFRALAVIETAEPYLRAIR
jgi:hypothetical protein